MADILSLSIIIVSDVLLILAGLYSGYKFIRAYLDGQDIMKYQGYLFNAFFLIIVLPLIITIGGLQLAESSGGDKIALSVKTSDLRENSEKVSFSFNPYRNEIDLNIFNDAEKRKTFLVNISCMNTKCDKTLDLLVEDEKEFSVEPKMTINLPISITFDDASRGEYRFNVSIRDEDSLYDSIPLSISVR